MLAPKFIYIIIIIWLFIRGFNVCKENKMDMFYTSTKALAPMCFCQARRVKKNFNSQRSAVPLLLILLANEIEINPGPETSQSQPLFRLNDPDA